MEDISPQRTNSLRTAVELGVDESDFRFQSFAERELWTELVELHETCMAKDDLVWLAA
jgi:hypothetical protein